MRRLAHVHLFLLCKMVIQIEAVELKCGFADQLLMRTSISNTNNLIYSVTDAIVTIYKHRVCLKISQPQIGCATVHFAPTRRCVFFLALW